MNCSVCNDSTLYHYLHENFSDIVTDTVDCVTPLEVTQDEVQFRECLEVFVASCNQERQTAEGYELCEDLDTETGMVTFYIMREDGECMLELPVLFVRG